MIIITIILNTLFFILFNILKPLQFGKLFKYDLILFRMKYDSINKCYNLQTKLGLFWFNIYTNNTFTKYGLIFNSYIHNFQKKKHCNSNYFYDYAYYIKIEYKHNQLHGTQVFGIREYFNKQFNITE